MPELDPPLRLPGKPRAGGHRSAPCTPVPKVAAIPRKSPGRGSDLGEGGCFVPVLGGGGTQHKGLAREGGLPTWAGPGSGRPSPRGGFRASCRAGLGEGEAVGAGPSTPGLSAGLSALSGGRVSGVRIGLTQLQLRSRQGPAWRSNQREKVSNGTDVRPLTPTSRVRNQAGGAGALVVVPGAQFGASGRAARRHDRRLRIPAARRCSLPGRTQRAFTPKHPPFPGSRSAFSSSRAP